MPLSTRKLVLITGASAGIGAAFAEVYAQAGYDVALTARRTDRLEALATTLRANFGVEALVFPADLAQPGAVDTLIADIAKTGRTVDALVNNAGYGLPGTYAATDWSQQQDFLQVLLVSVCALTHKLLPGMIERGFGRIINVASLAGLVPGMPSHTLYGATKSFLVKFSQSLHLETLGTGVQVSALCPGFTYSEFQDVNGTRRQTEWLPSWMWLDSLTVARSGFDAVEANRPMRITGWPNVLIAGLAKLLPEDLVLDLAGSFVRKRRGLNQPL